jgi:hypothetical protein
MNRAPAPKPIPDMGVDNTDIAVESAGSLVGDSAANEIINQVHHGMRVVDASGEEIGNVEDIKLGDPRAATVSPASQPDPGLIAAFFGGVEPDVPEPLRSRLLRFGYVKVDGKGWIDTDRYITADKIASVTGDTVTLTVDKDRLLEER